MRESRMQLDSSSISDAKHPQAACELDHQVSQTASAREQSHEETYNRQHVVTWLEKNVPAKRLHHILRVEEMATALARHHRLDVHRAAQAGLMHDLAKCFKAKHLLQLAWEHSIPIDPIFEANPHLLHADVGAIVAHNEFGIQDEDVLEAIRNHTLGSAGMNSLSCVVFLADTLEPGRGDSLELQALREVCWQDLHRAVWLTSEYTLKYLFESKSLIHPRALLTRNWAMQVVMNPSKAA